MLPKRHRLPWPCTCPGTVLIALNTGCPHWIRSHCSILKRRYQPGQRSNEWRKLKVPTHSNWKSHPPTRMHIPCRSITSTAREYAIASTWCPSVRAVAILCMSECRSHCVQVRGAGTGARPSGCLRSSSPCTTPKREVCLLIIWSSWRWVYHNPVPLFR